MALVPVGQGSSYGTASSPMKSIAAGGGAMVSGTGQLALPAPPK